MSIVEQALKLAQQSKARPSQQAPEQAAATLSPRDAASTATVAETSAQRPLTLDQANALPSIVLDVQDLRQQGRLVPADGARQLSDEMRRIKWPLLRAVKADAGASPATHNIVQITSAQPGEGKTFTALSLALNVVLDKELRVVLIDGDVARPGLTSALHLIDRPGLTDALQNPAMDLDTITYRTDVEGLYIVPSGRPHERTSELLATDRMQEILRHFGGRVGNGLVLVDSPPLLATNEAQVMTRHVGHVLLVVRADFTEHGMVRDAIALIEEGAKVSAILNAIRPSKFGRYYGEYGYHYSYADGSSALDKSRG